MRRYIIATAILVSVMLTPALGDTVDTWLINGYSGYNGSVDTYLDGFSPTVNRSTENSFLLRSISTTPYRVPMLRFDVSSLPSNAVVTKAELRVWVNSALTVNGNFQVWALKKDWTASTTTWNTTDGTTSWATAGALGIADRGSAAVSDRAIDFAVGYQGYTYIDVTTGMVQSWIDTPSSNYGFQLASTGADVGIPMMSNEVTWGVQYKPALHIEYTVPEPASLGLILLGSLGFIARQRRK